MTRDEMVNEISSIKNPVAKKNVVYAIARELGLNLRPSSCQKCIRDAFNIVKEELGLIKSAASQSKF